MSGRVMFALAIWLTPALCQATAPGEDGMSRQRYLEYYAQLFDQWDTNHDGVLSAQERSGLQAAQDAARAPPRPKRPLLHPSK